MPVGIANATLGFALLAVLVLKLSLFPLSNSDMTEYALIWLAETRARGAAVLGEAITDYSPAYSYLLLLAAQVPEWVKPISAIKLISLAGDMALALVAGLLVLELRGCGRHALATAALVFVLPTVLINGSVWGQTDAIWTSALLAALLAMLKGRAAAAVLLFGLAFAFKPQAAFLGPMLLAFLLVRRQPGWLLLLPLPYVVLAVPPLLAGRSAASVFGVYAEVFDDLSELSYDAPGLWTLLQSAELAGQGGVLPGLVLAGAVGVGCSLLPYLTPKTMGRYFFAAEVILAILACLDPRLLAALIASQVAALLAYEPFLLGLLHWRVPVAVLFETLAIFLVMRLWWRIGRHPDGLHQPLSA
jgi:hypothetical protein